MTTLERLQEIFRAVFAREDLMISPETNASQVDGWDSFVHINLIVEIEQAFGVKFTTKEIGAFECVGDVVRLVEEKLA